MTLRLFFLSTAALGLTALAIVGGCNKSDNSTNSTLPTGAPQLVSAHPANGAVAVEPASPVSMKFNMPMDTNSVHLNFHLAGGTQMALWMDSMTQRMGMGGMGMMNMGHMMLWMDSIQYQGQLHWNSSMDSCWFSADSGLMPNTDQMIYMYTGVKGQNGHMMVMDTFQYGGYMDHFMTKP
jgi:hypothetical protein